MIHDRTSWHAGNGSRRHALGCMRKTILQSDAARKPRAGWGLAHRPSDFSPHAEPPLFVAATGPAPSELDVHPLAIATLRRLCWSADPQSEVAKMSLLRLPTPEQALRGRPQRMPVAARHTVLGTPMEPPFPPGMHMALLG